MNYLSYITLRSTACSCLKVATSRNKWAQVFAKWTLLFFRYIFNIFKYK